MEILSLVTHYAFAFKVDFISGTVSTTMSSAKLKQPQIHIITQILTHTCLYINKLESVIVAKGHPCNL